MQNHLIQPPRLNFVVIPRSCDTVYLPMGLKPSRMKARPASVCHWTLPQAGIRSPSPVPALSANAQTCEIISSSCCRHDWRTHDAFQVSLPIRFLSWRPWRKRWIDRDATALKFPMGESSEWDRVGWVWVCVCVNLCECVSEWVWKCVRSFVHLSVCVCVRERERERDWACSNTLRPKFSLVDNRVIRQRVFEEIQSILSTSQIFLFSIVAQC